MHQRMAGADRASSCVKSHPRNGVMQQLLNGAAAACYRRYVRARPDLQVRRTALMLTASPLSTRGTRTACRRSNGRAAQPHDGRTVSIGATSLGRCYTSDRSRHFYGKWVPEMEAPVSPASGALRSCRLMSSPPCET